jgi:transforming growth factor-beta-induced protein
MFMLKKIFLPIVALMALFALAGCSEDTNPLSPGDSNKIGRDEFDSRNTIGDVVLSVNRDSGEFSTLIAALKTVGFTDGLFDRDLRTVFAPTDAAFAELGLDASSIRAIEPEALSNILNYHMAKGKLEASDVVATKQIRMLNNTFTLISLKDGDAFIDDSLIIQTDIKASNGVIHIIDAVLLPGEPEDYSDSTRDILFPRPTLPSIVEVAASVNAETGEFSTLIAALKIAELVDTLDGRNPYTVFAPTDEAFAKLGLNADNVGSLGVADLTQILLYHVTNGRLLASDVLSFEQIRMLTTDFTRISMVEDAAFIDSSRIIQTDVGARNGVIHIIDTVLLPGQENTTTDVSLDRTISF